MQLSVAGVQLQPVPEIPAAVSPAGSASETVTAPLVDPVPLFRAVIVYVAALCPCVKLPVRLGVRQIGARDYKVSREILAAWAGRQGFNTRPHDRNGKTCAMLAM